MGGMQGLDPPLNRRRIKEFVAAVLNYRNTVQNRFVFCMNSLIFQFSNSFLINWMRVIPLQCVCILDHHNVHIKSLTILSIKALTKLKKFILCDEFRVYLIEYFFIKCLFLCLVIFHIHLYLIHIFCVSLLSFGFVLDFFLNFFECIYCKVSLRLLANMDFFSSGNGSFSRNRDLNNILKIIVDLQCCVSFRYNGNPLQYSCLGNPMDGGAWWAAVHGVTKSQTRLSDLTFIFHFPLSCIGEGNGNPLQCSCLENPRDGGACWAAVCGVTQSRIRLMQLSSTAK